MKKNDRKPQETGVAGARGKQRPAHPAPGKGTPASKLPARRKGPVQRQPSAGSSTATPQVQSAWDWTMDPAMEAVHRGTPMPAARASGSQGSVGGGAAAAPAAGVVQRQEEDEHVQEASVDADAVIASLQFAAPVVGEQANALDIADALTWLATSRTRGPAAGD